MTFSKLLVAWLLVNGTVWIYLSYALAYLGRGQIAETLSKTVVVEVIGVMVVYSLKALVENLSKNNQWPDRQSKTTDKIEKDL
jgi:ABC-type transport system involved in cytochrome bd biosynthesis fused ATPase/permease subunit